ncbi:hypothetical protein NUW54_g12972 [Trametes sanguinea]|uniref:Uncharacterized protein n=1 Tax=Trametes sanguinea TaxID=158606 RepID=A0ACC1MR10_9APHY|nr:hypothetical protein NUW54_g12972 [Trametes sanguinea]
MFYFAYAGHNIPPKRIEFGKIQKNPPGPNGGGTRISITGKTPEEKAVWQTLGEGNEDCVEWVVLCAALNLLDDEIIKAAEKNPPPPSTPGAPVPYLNSVRTQKSCRTRHWVTRDMISSLTCVYCDAKLTSLADLRYHLGHVRRHAVYACCGRFFKREEDYERHVQSDPLRFGVHLHSFRRD